MPLHGCNNLFSSLFLFTLLTLLKKCKICTAMITSWCTFLDDRIVGFVFLKCKLLSFPLEKMCDFALPLTICEYLFLHPSKRQHLKDFYWLTFGPFLFFSPTKYKYHSLAIPLPLFFPYLFLAIQFLIFYSTFISLVKKGYAGEEKTS